MILESSFRVTAVCLSQDVSNFQKRPFFLSTHPFSPLCSHKRKCACLNESMVRGKANQKKYESEVSQQEIRKQNRPVSDVCISGIYSYSAKCFRNSAFQKCSKFFLLTLIKSHNVYINIHHIRGGFYINVALYSASVLLWS